MRRRSVSPVARRFPAAGHCPACGYAAAHIHILADGTRRVLHILTQVFPCDIPPDPEKTEGGSRA